MKYFSQKDQDYIVDTLLKGKERGFFLDFGAHDGISLSNSYFFESTRNWDGVCLEPIPEVFAKLQKNRRCNLLNGAVSTSSENLQFKKMQGKTEMLSGLVKFREEAHDKRTDKGIKKYGGKVELITVRGYSIGEIFEKFNIRNIDYLTIDIEGGEFEVLETIDLQKYPISCLTVENNYGDVRIRKLMKTNGYKLVFHHGADDFYFRKELINIFSYINNWRILRIWLRSHLRFSTHFRKFKSSKIWLKN